MRLKGSSFQTQCRAKKQAAPIIAAPPALAFMTPELGSECFLALGQSHSSRPPKMPNKASKDWNTLYKLR